MKKIIIGLISLVSIGCSTEVTALPPPSVDQPKVEANSCDMPEKPENKCVDALHIMSYDDLKKGFSCPAHSKMELPTFYQNNHVLVLCKCLR